MAKKEYQTWNPGDNYFDSMLANVLWNQMYPEGQYRTEEDQYGGRQQIENDPIYQGPNARHGARVAASEKEDEALRGALGSSRGRRRGEPEGAYSLANHPGLQSAMDWAGTGNTPGGSAHIGMWLQEQGDPRLQYENMRRRKEWAARQRELLGGWGR